MNSRQARRSGALAPSRQRVSQYVERSAARADCEIVARRLWQGVKWRSPKRARRWRTSSASRCHLAERARRPRLLGGGVRSRCTRRSAPCSWREEVAEARPQWTGRKPFQVLVATRRRGAAPGRRVHRWLCDAAMAARIADASPPSRGAAYADGRLKASARTTRRVRRRRLRVLCGRPRRARAARGLQDFETRLGPAAPPRPRARRIRVRAAPASSSARPRRRGGSGAPSSPARAPRRAKASTLRSGTWRTIIDPTHTGNVGRFANRQLRPEPRGAPRSRRVARAAHRALRVARRAGARGIDDLVRRQRRRRRRRRRAGEDAVRMRGRQRAAAGCRATISLA